MKNKIYYAVGIVSQSRTIAERGKIDTPNRQIYDHSHSWFGTSTSLKSGDINKVLWAQASPLSKMIWSWKCFLNVRQTSRIKPGEQRYHKERYDHEHYA